MRDILNESIKKFLLNKYSSAIFLKFLITTIIYLTLTFSIIVDIYTPRVLWYMNPA